MTEPHVLRWWPGEPDHPIIDELKSRPGEWAVLWERGPEPTPLPDAFFVCDRHKRVEVHVQRGAGMYASDQSISARWIPDEEWTDIQGRKLAAKETPHA